MNRTPLVTSRHTNGDPNRMVNQMGKPLRRTEMFINVIPDGGGLQLQPQYSTAVFTDPDLPNHANINRRRDILLQAGQRNQSPSTLLSSDSKQLRLLLQPPPPEDQRQGSQAQWSRFWKTHIPHQARTIW
ncbi:hypothetical protein BGZ82_005195 [Podila clonocystis]|nr:hypothetical protein BGZ82_005195 [Podila clonocystis]